MAELVEVPLALLCLADAEHDGLGRSTHIFRNLTGRQAEDFHGRGHVNILAVGKDREESLVLR